ncbi:hypothetical protein ACH9L7_02040 [Haloferax sp. S1W]|uniref:hypothetical protein n=1 Tax=Haloferax sp. S1W TaxID=3377110 RepID=UPI0037CB3FB4
MAQEAVTETSGLSDEQIAKTMTMVKRMLIVGAIFVVVGYLLIGAALFFELTTFHPLVDDYYSNSKAVRDAAPTGSALNAQLAEINKWPSTLLWLKLGGIGHILAGVFIALAGILRALSMMPDRLGNIVSTTMKPDAGVADPADD